MILPHINDILGSSFIFYFVTESHITRVTFLDFFRKHLTSPLASFDANASARKDFSFFNTWFWANLNLYADDTTLINTIEFSTPDEDSDPFKTINDELYKVSDWLVANRLSLDMKNMNYLTSNIPWVSY